MGSAAAICEGQSNPPHYSLFVGRACASVHSRTIEPRYVRLRTDRAIPFGIRTCGRNAMLRRKSAANVRKRTEGGQASL